MHEDVPRPRTRMAPQQRQAIILQSALRLFEEVGYEGASIDAIAAASGISGPAIYRHFSGKAALLCALIEDVVENAVAAMEAALDEAADPLGAMADVMAERALMGGSVIGLLQARLPAMAAAEQQRLDSLRATLRGRLSAMVTMARPDLSE